MKKNDPWWESLSLEELREEFAALEEIETENQKALAEAGFHCLEKSTDALWQLVDERDSLHSSLAEVAALIKGMQCETNEVRINGYRVQRQHDASCLRCAALAAMGKVGGTKAEGTS